MKLAESCGTKYLIFLLHEPFRMLAMLREKRMLLPNLAPRMSEPRAHMATMIMV